MKTANPLGPFTKNWQSGSPKNSITSVRNERNPNRNSFVKNFESTAIAKATVTVEYKTE